MNALVMAGGGSTRMNSGTEKLLLEIGGQAMILHTVKSLSNSGLFDDILCATSPNAPQTAQILKNAGIKTSATSGLGYSHDLGEAIGRLRGTVLIVSGDMPMMDMPLLRKMIGLHKAGSAWTSYVMSKKFSASLGAENPNAGFVGKTECVHTGVLLVDADMYAGRGAPVEENLAMVDDARLGVNINTPGDYESLVGFS